MAYGEKLLNVSDLLSAWQNRSMREGNADERAARKKMMNEQIRGMQEQNKMAEWQNIVAREMPVTSVPVGDVANGISGHRFTKDVTNMSGIMGGGGGGGGGESLANQNEPGSYYTYGQNEAKRQGEQSQATADLMGAQAGIARQKEQGVGSATADLLAQQALNQNQSQADAALKNQTDIANLNSNTQKEIAKMYAGAKENVATIENAGQGSTDNDKRLMGSAARSWAKDDSYNKLDASSKIVAQDTYAKLNSSPEFNKLPTTVRAWAANKLPAIILHTGGNVADISQIIKNIKEDYNTEMMNQI